MKRQHLTSNLMTEKNTRSFPHEGYVGMVMMTDTVGTLNSAFGGHTDKNPTLLFMQEHVRRVAGLDDEGTINGLVGNIDLSSPDNQVVTVASLNWAPYEYKNSGWVRSDTEAYLLKLTTNYQNDVDFLPADNSQDELDESNGRKIWLQLYYASLMSGHSQLVQADTTVLWAPTDPNISVPEVTFSPDLGSRAQRGPAYIIFQWRVINKNVNRALGPISATTSAKGYFKQLSVTLNESKLAVPTSKSRFKTMVYGGKSPIRLAEQTKVHRNLNNSVIAVLTVAAVTITAISQFGTYGNYPVLAAVAKYSGLALGLVLPTFQLITWVQKISIVRAQFGKNITGFASKVKALRNVGRGITPGFVGILISAGVVFGFASAGLAGLKPGTVAFNTILAGAIGHAIVILITVVVELILWLFGLGPLLLLFYLIDILVEIFTGRSLTGRMAEAWAKLIYKVDDGIENLGESDRLDFDVASFTLADTSLGFQEGNATVTTVNVTNTIRYFSKLTTDDARSATFTYNIDRSAIDRSNQISLGQMRNAWEARPSSHLRYTTQISNTTPMTISTSATGINNHLDIYINESFKVFYQQCWFGYGAGVWRDKRCTQTPYGSTLNIPLGESIVLDIFPDTVTEFYKRDWSSGGVTTVLSFPVQTDWDSDGLLSKGQGGTDPDDTKFDTDGDTLSDKFELANNSDPNKVDTDGDGLTDAEEFIYGTKVNNIDTDGDLISDYNEINGWLFAYQENPRKVTRVWSDPFTRNGDGDTMGDLTEFTYALHPGVPTDSSYLRSVIRFDDIRVGNAAAPITLFELDLAGLSESFANLATDGSYGQCQAATCPTSGVDGRYEYGLSFASGDVVTTTVEARQDAYGVGLWFNTSQVNSGLFALTAGQLGASGHDGSLYLDGSGNVCAQLVSETICSSGTNYADGTWHHVAHTFGASLGGQQLYVDKVMANSGSTAVSTLTNQDSLVVGYAPATSNSMVGTIDEVVVYDYALTGEDVTAIYGRLYQANNGIVGPADQLRYEATVTNTHPLLSVSGQMVGDSAYVDPAIAEPEMVLHFDNDDYVTTLPNSSGEASQVNCLGDGSCPTSETGARGLGLAFDGVNDVMSLPAMAYDESSLTIAFWLKVDTLPAAGQKMMIFDTSRREDGSAVNGDVDIYLDENGYLWFETAGATPDSYHYTCSSGYDTCNNLDNAWAQMHRSDMQFTAGSGYVHVVWTGGSLMRLYINDDLDSYITYSATPNKFFGSGTIGQAADGTAAFDGSIDELVLYREAWTKDESNIDRVTNVYNGQYYMINNSGVSDSVPTVVYEFSTDISATSAANVYTNDAGPDAACIDVATCPTPLLNGGVVGDAVEFDGVDDSLPINDPSTVTFFDGSIYVNPDSVPTTGNRAYLFDVGFSLYIGDDGLLRDNNDVVVHNFDFNSVANTDTWTQVNFYHYNNFSSGCVRRIDVTINGSTTTTTLYNCNGVFYFDITAGRIGSNSAGASLFDGKLDQFVLTDNVATTEISIPFEAISDQLVSWRDGVTAGRVADCYSLVFCPSLAATGVYSQSVSFDGTNDFLEANDVDLKSKSWTVATWAYQNDVSINNQYFVNQGINSSGQGFIFGKPTSFQVECGFIGDTLVVSTLVGNSTWIHWACSYDYDTNTLTLYRHGVQVGTKTVTTAYTGSGPLYLGRAFDGTTQFNGRLDDLVILGESVDASQVAALMAGPYPPIVIPDDFITYTASANTSVVVSGTAAVADYVLNGSRIGFDQEVEAALQLQSSIPYEVVDAYSSDLLYYLPFDDVPGSTTFDNLVTGTVGCFNSDANRCPTAGLRGRVDRTAYFDGQSNLVSGGFINEDRTGFTVASWVKADRGTVVSAGPLELDVDRLEVRSWCDVDPSLAYQQGIVYETAAFDMPENEWVYLAATVNKASGTAVVYVNGAVAATLDTCVNDDASNQFDFLYTQLFVGGNNNQLGYDPLLGYIDDLRVYETTLSQAAIQSLQATSAPILRFEFEEDTTATAFVDSSENGYVGQPTTKACSNVAFNDVTVSGALSTTTQIQLLLDDHQVMQKTIAALLSGPTDLGIDTLVCGSQTLKVNAIRNGTVTQLGSTDTVAASATTVSDSGNSFAALVDSGTVSFGLDWVIDPSSDVVSPIPGAAGQSGRAPEFEGNGEIVVVNGSAAVDFANDFSVMMWVNTSQNGSTVNLWSEDNGDGTTSSDERFFVFDDTTVRFVDTGNGAISANEEIATGFWRHVAVTWDNSSDTGKIYVDGIDVTASSAYTGGTADSNTNSLKIGPKTAGGFANFIGQMDEFAIYSRALTSVEMRSTYLRELRWFRATETTEFLIDSTAPTLSYLSGRFVRQPGSHILAVSVSDDLSQIANVEMGLSYFNSNTSMWETTVWEDVYQCDDSDTVWCPVLNAAAGRYLVTFRATDSAGNQAETSSVNLSFDGTAPYINPTYSDTRVVATPVSNQAQTWTIRLDGTTYDPNVNGVTSQLRDTTHLVELIDADTGQSLNGAQQVVVTQSGGGSGDYPTVWYIDYLADNGLVPSGRYTVTVQATDLAFNQMTATSIGTVIVDTRVPSVDLNRWDIGAVITQATTISGTIMDAAVFSGPLYHLHFEESGTPTTFYNSSARMADYHATCTNCPIPTTGLYGQAADFNGTSHKLSLGTTSDVLDLDGMTLNVWVKPDSQTTMPIFNNLGRSYIGLENGVPTAMMFWADPDGAEPTVNGTTPLETTRFTLLTTTYDGATLRLYVDGKLVGSAAAGTGNIVNGFDMILGGFNGGFDGQIDEFMLYDRVLADSEIEALADTSGAGVANVEVALHQLDTNSVGATTFVTGTWQSAAVAGSGLLGTWTYQLPTGLEGYYEIDVRGTDANLSTSNDETVWRNVIDMVSPGGYFIAEIGGGSGVTRVAYDYVFTDFVLDETTLTGPCDASDVIYTRYQIPGHPLDGLPYRAAAYCTMNLYGAESAPAVTVSMCDAVGNCRSDTQTPTGGDGGPAIVVYTPTHKSVLTYTHPFTISGRHAGAGDTINTIMIAIDGLHVDTMTPANTTLGDWSSTAWQPTAAGTYQLSAVALTSYSGTITDTVTVTLTQASGVVAPAPTLPVSRAVNNSTLTLSWPAGSGSCGYNIYSSTSPYGGYALFASGLSSTSYDIALTTMGNTAVNSYYYVLEGCGTSGQTSPAIGEFDFSLTPGS